jgi:hypothetical protein
LSTHAVNHTATNEGFLLGEDSDGKIKKLTPAEKKAENIKYLKALRKKAFGNTVASKVRVKNNETLEDCYFRDISNLTRNETIADWWLCLNLHQKVKAIIQQFDIQARAIWIKKLRITENDVSNILEAVPKLVAHIQAWFGKLPRDDQMEIMAAAFVSKVPLDSDPVNEKVFAALNEKLGTPKSESKKSEMNKARKLIKKWVVSQGE